MSKPTTQAGECLAFVARLVADDAWAASFQTTSQYRTAVLQAIADEAARILAERRGEGPR
uniref:Uncharacterized protein n=1 Tax=viral metagenome TaxID=1070528 RepID=A0A6M3J853_9ZZZZ